MREHPDGERAPAVTAARVAAIIAASLAAGYVVYRFVQIAVGWLWTDVPANTFGGRAPWPYVLGIPLLAGLLVTLSRSLGSDGHNPLYGFSRDPVKPRAFPTMLLSILITLVGGLVLGPEMALVATGSVVGVALAGPVGDSELTKWSGIGSLAALAALAVEPLRTGHLYFGEGYRFTTLDLLTALVAAAVTAVAIGGVRLGAFALMRLRGGDRPVAWQLGLGGLAVGGLALAYQSVASQPIDMVLTSGEQMIKPLVMLGSAGLIAATVAVKSLCYLVSMGTGFRGGPYFPVMFAGTGIGAAIGLLTTGSAEAPGIAGLLAATIFLAKPPWPAVLVIGVVVGLAFGGVALLPAALIGAVVGQVIPRFREHAAPKADAESASPRPRAE